MKAIVIGATGLVGNLILKEVLSDNDFSEVGGKSIFLYATSDFDRY